MSVHGLPKAKQLARAAPRPAPRPPVKPIDLVLSRLPGAKRFGESWRCACPSHGGTNKTSLKIDVGDGGRVLFSCKSRGCTADAIIKKLELPRWVLGPDEDIAPAAPRRTSKPPPASISMPPPSKPDKPVPVYAEALDAIAALETRLGAKWTAIWGYLDDNGEPGGATLRFSPEPGSTEKRIRPISRRADGWVLQAMELPRPLYRLTELKSTSGRVFVTEGEKAAEAGRSLGLTVTTSAGGASAAKFTCWEALAGREVIILPDNDEPGMRFAEDVVRLLFKQDAAAVVKVVTLPSLPPRGDLFDFVEARDSVEDADLKIAIETLASKAAVEEPPQPERAVERPAASPVIVRMSDVKPELVEWLWSDRFAIGKLTLIAGDPGLGKSLITLDMAARLSRGTPWPDALDEHVLVGGTVLLSAEDDPGDTIRPRLDAAGADASKIAVMTGITRHDSEGDILDSFNLASDLSALELAIEQTPDCRLVVIDPITAYLGRTDSYKNAELRGLLAPLAELAQRRRVVVVAVTHLRKGEGAAIYRTMGSLAFVAAARAAWGVVKDKDNPRRRLMLPIKNNLAPDVQGLAYAIGGTGPLNAPVLLWSDEPVTVDVDEAMAPPKRGGEEVDLEEWVKSRKGGCTVSELARSGPRQFRGRTDAAKAALDVLVVARVCRRSDSKPGKRRGKPTTHYIHVSEWNGYDTPDFDSTSEGIVSTPGKDKGGYDTHNHDSGRAADTSTSTSDALSEQAAADAPGECDDPGPSANTPRMTPLARPPLPVDADWRPVPDDIPITRESI